jgi:hypothetical protein
MEGIPIFVGAFKRFENFVYKFGVIDILLMGV